MNETVNKEKIVEVVINEKGTALDRTFDYILPAELALKASPGKIALVPFGKSNKKREAFIMSVKSDAKKDIVLKEVADIFEPAMPITDAQLKICDFLREEYFCTYSDALSCALPKFARKTGKEQYKSSISLSEKYKTKEEYLSEIKSNARAQRLAIELLNEEFQDLDEFKKINNISGDAIKKLQEKNLITIIRNEFYDTHYGSNNIKKQNANILSDEQKKVLDEYYKSDKNNFLLHGITGSGKTEVYLNMIQDALDRGRQALYLLPEIALTAQTVARIKERFGDCAVIHSRLSQGERYYQYKKIASGEAKVILGARSALFYPYKDLGIIVLDECHEESYKSTSSPRYDSIEIAEYMSELSGAKLVLGSATPLIESYYYAACGKYHLLNLPNRIFNRELPNINIIDMRQELKGGNKSVFSSILENCIQKALDKREQAILFLNRRGMYTYVFCRKCGYSERCPSCDVALTYHSDIKKLMCHYCGYEKDLETHCPECGSDKIRHMGTGTQKIESEILSKFPYARIIRMDKDTTSTKYAFDEITENFKNHKADLLIGTQMVVKGFDFPLVSVVGVVLADMALNMPDIYSSFRAFCLAYQAAGRCGREKGGGDVIIQTYSPEHYVIKHIHAYDYEGFYKDEIKYRKKLSYPPFSQMYGFYFIDENEEKAKNTAYEFAQSLIDEIKDEQCRLIKIYRPAKPEVSYINNKYIFHVIVKTSAEKNIKNAMKIVYNNIIHKNNIHAYMQKNSGV
ncbi:MAG: primosomal protein N' [Eubacteriaceae bacterium]